MIFRDHIITVWMKTKILFSFPWWKIFSSFFEERGFFFRFQLWLLVPTAFLTGHSVARFVRSLAPLTRFAGRHFAMFTGSLSHFAHSLVGQLKFMNLCLHIYTHIHKTHIHTHTRIRTCMQIHTRIYTQTSVLAKRLGHRMRRMSIDDSLRILINLRWRRRWRRAKMLIFEFGLESKGSSTCDFRLFDEWFEAKWL